MRNRTTLTFAFLASLAIGAGLGWIFAPSDNDSSMQAAEEQPLYWVAPMDSNYRRDEPGLSPMGMELVPVFASELAAVGAGVSISPVVQANLGIRTEAVAFGSLNRLIETVGFVQYDEDQLQSVHTRVDGWIERLAVRATGDSVEAGQVLFELYSPTLVSAQEEFILALSSGGLNLVRASRERLAALGVSQAQIERVEQTRRPSRRIAVHARLSGVVSELRVREGEYLTPAATTMRIASLDEVWVVAEVLERQSGWVAAGQAVDVRLDAYPGEVWPGTVDYVYPELHQATRTLQVRVRIRNPDERIRPNMYARLAIRGTATAPSVHVPLEAVIRGGRGDRVVLATADGRFQSVRVDIGIETNGRVQIRGGLDEGDEIVVSGQFLIDSESSLTGEERRAGVTDSDSVASGTPEPIQGFGTVLGHTNDGRLRIRHAPIAALGWPAMSMPFALADRGLADGLVEGDEIHFTLTERDGRFVITQLMVVPSAPPDADVHTGHDMGTTTDEGGGEPEPEEATHHRSRDDRGGPDS